ncbi:MAG: gliding motility-associated C-terminal domain-containing protein [Bacteroidetes bacterium]|nr:gliding motility-associated C-terminal domain-containing protein [Bacteroidota bacterium]
MPITLLAIANFFASAQVNISLQITNATCSSNGSIQVTATGGSGNLNYQLFGGCLPVPVLQQVPDFNNLGPCEYIVVVTDGSTGASASKAAVVGGNYQSPVLALNCGSCSIETGVTGGTMPLTFAISTAGLNGPFQNNTLPGSPVFQNITPGTNYWVRVTDACGNVAVETCQTSGQEITGFTYENSLNGKLKVTGVAGGIGIGVYQYTLHSSIGNFTNYTGVFPPVTWGCNMTVTVTDGCTEFTGPVGLRPLPGFICANFADGSATLGPVINGIPPFTFTCTTPQGVFTSTTNELTGLPVGIGQYLFQITDACGNKSDAVYKQKKYPRFLQEPVSCGENSISIFAPTSGCEGGFDIDSWPVTVDCNSCSTFQTDQINQSGDIITFQGNQPGEWELSIEDGCGDHLVCKDSVILLLHPMCDSLQAGLVDRFTCDNDMISDRPMSTGSAQFVLKNEGGETVASNTSGLFYVPVPGNYKVVLNIPGCSIYEASATVGDLQPVNPVMNTYIYNGIIGGQCRTLYQLTINPADGPYILTGGPDDLYLLIDESYLTSSCILYSVTNLLPGDYELAQVAQCGIKQLHLPAPTFNLTAVPFGNCPGSGTITVSGAQSLSDWQAWGAANNATIDWPGSIIDNYSLDVVNSGQNYAQSGSPFSFVNVAAGTRTVYLYTLNSGCPVDTATVVVPEELPLSFDVSSGILCDGASTTALQFEILTGKPPYTIEQVDCNNIGQAVTSYSLNDTVFTISDISQGDYCFRLIDSCVISLDHQFSVQYYQDTVEVILHCDNTITFNVDSLNADYTWLDAGGNIVGNEHHLTIPNPNADVTFTVLVDIGECVIERSVTMPATAILPSLAIEGQPYFCVGDTVTLTAVSDAPLTVWGDGSLNSQQSVANAGVYSVTATNGLGCTATAEFLLTLDEPVVDILVQNGGLGFGVKCFNDSNGVLLAQPIVGVSPFNFVWSNQAITPQIEQLPPGEYAVTVTDAIGCTGTQNIELTQPELFVPEIFQKPPFCFGTDDGVVEISGWAGGAGDAVASLNGSVATVVPEKYDNLPPGQYRLEVQDGNGCRVDTSFYFAPPPELFLDLGEDLSIELGDSIHLAPSVSFWPVDSFRWRSNDPAPPTELDIWLTPLDNSYYYLQVWDKNGCMVEDKITVQVDKAQDIFVPNAFSPNGDGVNDFFTVYARSAQVSTIRSLQVFSRYGELVFVRENFQPNVEFLGWNGHLDGRELNPGVFAWKAEIGFIDGRVEVLTGDVMLVR